MTPFFFFKLKSSLKDPFFFYSPHQMTPPPPFIFCPHWKTPFSLYLACHLKDFYPIFYPFDPCFGILLGGAGGGVKMGPTFADFLCKIHHLDVTSPWILHRPMWSSSPSALVGAPKYFWFHQFMACIVMRISQPNYEKSVGNGAPFWNGICEVPPPSSSTQVVGP